MTQVLINSLAGACLNLLIGVSFWLIYATTKSFYISHAAAITSGAYGCYWFHTHIGLPLFVAVCVAIGLTAITFVALEKLLFHPLRSGVKWVGLVASIGVYIVLQNLISLGFGDETLRFNAHSAVIGQKIGDAYVTGAQELVIVSSAILFVGIAILLAATKFGREIRAVASNSDLCVILGINPKAITRSAIAVGSALAAIAGVLSAIDFDLRPTMGFGLLMNGVVVMIIAGVGNTSGFVWAALLLAFAQHLAGYCLDARWMDATAFVILIGFLIWKPVGFSGRRLKKAEV